jgi:ParB-like chromosome segregation protein Spo0J
MPLALAGDRARAIQTTQPVGNTMKIPIHNLVANPQNSNVVPEHLLKKLERNIKRTKLYPSLIVRPLRVVEGEDAHYQILDGHHRKMVLERLGYKDAECDIWEMTEREAAIALATLNRLRGTDDPRLRAELLDSLSQTIPMEQLAAMVPEDVSAIEDMQKLLLVDLDALEMAQRAAADKVKDESPKPLTFVLFPDQYVQVRNALDHMQNREDLKGKKNADGQALYLLCVEYLSSVGWESAQEEIAQQLPPVGAGG